MKKLLAASIALAALATAAPAPAAPETTLSRFIATVNYEADAHGIGPVRVSVDDIGEPIALTTWDGEIVVNSRYAYMTPWQFNGAIADDVARGTQPPGCGAIESVAMHEMGHVFDGWTGLRARDAVAHGEFGRNDLHGYAFNADGSVDPGEAVAVAFQAVECGSATPAERAIYDVLIG